MLPKIACVEPASTIVPPGLRLFSLGGERPLSRRTCPEAGRHLLRPSPRIWQTLRRGRAATALQVSPGIEALVARKRAAAAAVPSSPGTKGTHRRGMSGHYCCTSPPGLKHSSPGERRPLPLQDARNDPEQGLRGLTALGRAK